MVCGSWGTGGSHLLEALGHAVIEAGHHVSWFSLEEVAALLHRRRADGSVARAVRRVMRAELTIVDDISFYPSPPRPLKPSTASSTRLRTAEPGPVVEPAPLRF